jgi:hypothetical protein
MSPAAITNGMADCPFWVAAALAAAAAGRLLMNSTMYLTNVVSLLRKRHTSLTWRLP